MAIGSTQIGYTDKVDGSSYVVAADMNEIKDAVNANGDILDTTNLTVTEITATYESVTSTPATISASGFDHTVFAQTVSTSSDIDLTITNASAVNDRLTIVAVGTYDVNLTITGLTSEVVPGGEARSYVWTGSAWYLASGGGGASGGAGATAIGGIYWWATLIGGAPTGAFKCDGSTKNIADYPSLYAIIGTEYGGDGITTFGLPLKDGIVYSNETSGEVEVDTNGVWVIQAESVESTSADFTGFYNATEMPTYGEPLATGELFLDGTKSYVSSDNRSPVVDVVDYFASKYSVDGITVDEDRSKWPGQRGTYGFFGEYKNESLTEVLGSACTADAEGGWRKVLATAASSGTTATAIKLGDGTTLSNNGYSEAKVRKGNVAVSYVSMSADVGSAVITWATQSVSYTGGAVDAGTYWAGDDTVVIRMTGDGGTGAAVFMYLYANSFSSTASGDYTYFKDWMFVDLDYPVPYTPGTHPASKLQYNLDWASSDEWTIEGWFYANEQLGDAQFLLMLKSDGGFDSIYSYYLNNEWVLSSTSAGTNSAIVLTGVVDQAWNYIKYVFTSATSVDVYVNNEAVQSKILNIPSVSVLNKLIDLGNRQDDALRPFRSYLQDWTIQPTIDISTTHYDNGLPYYDPNKIVGKNGSWAIDEMGNMSGFPQVSGIIVEDYELDGQRVTKWDSGLMIISHNIDVSGSANPAVVNFTETFTNDPAVTVTVRSTGAQMGTVAGVITTEFSLYRFTSGGSATTAGVCWIAIGQWK